MQDHLLKATSNGIRVFAAVTTNLVGEACKRHNCFPVAAAALGRTMTGAVLLAANLKTKECVTLKIAGDGVLGKIVADANAEGFVRGYVDHPQVNLPLNAGKLAVGEAVGKGLISLTRFTGLKNPFTGSSELITGEIAEDITNYLCVSEQTPSSVGLGVLVNPELKILAAGGFFIQALPEVEDSALDVIEKNLKSLEPVSQMIYEGLDAKGIIAEIFKTLPVNYFENQDLQFKCQCSKEKIQGILISLGREELVSLYDDGEAEVSCHFCGNKYQFAKEELESLLNLL
ncbi:Hsp33 family molecular chaperone HslO [Anaerosinus massiliensis]|uniref:Hsp33 family molecular chaperone HslO n=1 Tax=Massilibacillus massiliensis TaxID=1806837 RepID=UPI000AE01624|nr:Hsp33 family molecular chaperone HslO [Massilibacillus massiliensis]